MKTTLHQFAASPFCDKIRRVLRVKKIPFEVHEWPLAEVGDIGAKNPAGKLPILDIDGETIADSTNIALEIEKRRPEPPLLPKDPADRARVLILEDWADESLYFYEMATRFGDQDFERNVSKLMPDAPAEMQAQLGPAIREMLRGTCAAQGTGRKPDAVLAADVERLFDAIEKLVEPTGFAVGNGLTLADIAIAAQAECIGDSTVGKRAIAAHPVLRDYLAKIDRLTKSDRV